MPWSMSTLGPLLQQPDNTTMADQQQQQETSEQGAEQPSDPTATTPTANAPDRQRQQFYYQKIRDFLDQNNVGYQTVHHEETLTSEESARVRGVPLSTGGKALLLKMDGDDGHHHFALFVVSASRKLNSKAVKKERKRRGQACKNIRFATREELGAITNGLVPGCVPPFGKPILRIENGANRGGGETPTETDRYLDLYVDTSIAEENETIAFNAGSLTDSVIMSVPEYLRVSNPTGIFAFSKE